MGLLAFSRGSVAWEGEHVRLVLQPKDSKSISREVVCKISASLRKIGCRCDLDESTNTCRAPSKVHVDYEIPCVNRFLQLAVDDEHTDELSRGGNVDMSVVCRNVLGKNDRKHKIVTWNFSGLASERK